MSRSLQAEKSGEDDHFNSKWSCLGKIELKMSRFTASKNTDPHAKQNEASTPIRLQSFLAPRGLLQNFNKRFTPNTITARHKPRLRKKSSDFATKLEDTPVIFQDERP